MSVRSTRTPYNSLYDAIIQQAFENDMDSCPKKVVCCLHGAHCDEPIGSQDVVQHESVSEHYENLTDGPPPPPPPPPAERPQKPLGIDNVWLGVRDKLKNMEYKMKKKQQRPKSRRKDKKSRGEVSEIDSIYGLTGLGEHPLRSQPGTHGNNSEENIHASSVVSKKKRKNKLTISDRSSTPVEGPRYENISLNDHRFMGPDQKNVDQYEDYRPSEDELPPPPPPNKYRKDKKLKRDKVKIYEKKEEDLSKIYIGVLGVDEAEQHLDKKGHFRLYYQLQKFTSVDTMSEMAPLTIVYKTTQGQFRHYCIRSRRSGNQPVFYVDYGDPRAKNHSNMSELIRYYQNTVLLDRMLPLSLKEQQRGY